MWPIKHQLRYHRGLKISSSLSRLVTNPSRLQGLAFGSWPQAKPRSLLGQVTNLYLDKNYCMSLNGAE